MRNWLIEKLFKKNFRTIFNEAFRETFHNGNYKICTLNERKTILERKTEM